MTMTIDLAPELQAELARQAATQGVELDTYAASLIESAARTSNAPISNPKPSRKVIEAVET